MTDTTPSFDDVVFQYLPSTEQIEAEVMHVGDRIDSAGNIPTQVLTHLFDQTPSELYFPYLDITTELGKAICHFGPEVDWINVGTPQTAFPYPDFLIRLLNRGELPGQECPEYFAFRPHQPITPELIKLVRQMILPRYDFLHADQVSQAVKDHKLPSSFYDQYKQLVTKKMNDGLSDEMITHLIQDKQQARLHSYSDQQLQELYQKYGTQLQELHNLQEELLYTAVSALPYIGLLKEFLQLREQNDRDQLYQHILTEVTLFFHPLFPDTPGVDEKNIGVLQTLFKALEFDQPYPIFSPQYVVCRNQLLITVATLTFTGQPTSRLTELQLILDNHFQNYLLPTTLTNENIMCVATTAAWLTLIKNVSFLV